MDLSREYILGLLQGADDQGLFARACAVTRQVFKNRVHVRAIVEFSNHCAKHCLYCGLRSANKAVRRYRLDRDSILAACARAAASGAGTVVLQAGDDPGIDADFVAGLVKDVKTVHDVAVTLSLGDRSPKELALWKKSGADRYLLKLETTDPDLYARSRPGEKYSERMGRLLLLKRLGYEAGSGVITGLPGTSERSLATDILELSALDLDMIAVGPFIPHPDTPLGDSPKGSLLESLRTTAILRLLNPLANIPATSALDAAVSGGRAMALARGCNVVMPSATPPGVRRDYHIYPGKNPGRGDADDGLDRAGRTIKALGLSPSGRKGFSKRRSRVP